jgi:hypothetical protein
LVELEDQVVHSSRDLVADCSDLVELQARGVLEVPVKIHHDERRHIGYGVWFLRERCATAPMQVLRFVSATPRRVFAAEGESKRRFPEAMPRC